jgi:enediyne biosynthesis protein E4
MKVTFLCLGAALLGFAGAALAEPMFVDRAAGLPVAQVYDGAWEHFVGGGVAILDCNDDGLPDLYAAGGANPARLFVNVTTAPGAPITFADGGAAPLLNVTGAYPLDVDSDGILDLMVLRAGPNVLLRGEGACRFHDATAELGLPSEDRWSTTFTATWEGSRDWPTFVVGNYVDRSNPKGPFEACDDNALYRGTKGRFDAPIAISPGFCALSMLISDWKRTGARELRISNDRQYYVRAGREQMWRLDPLQEYTEADGWPTLRLWGMGIGSRDITGDGLPEVMLTSMGDQLLQFNRGNGVMADATYDIGSTATTPYIGDDGRPSTGWHAEFGDIDNDGLADLFIAKGNVDQMPSNAIHDPNNLLMQQPDGRFVERGHEAGIDTTERSRGAGLADLNADGLLDIVVMNRRAPMEIWQNATPMTGTWLEVEPRQKGTNTRAIGSWVEVRVGDAVQSQELTIGGGHVSGHAGPLHFGLGAAESAEVRIIWPDGTASEWQEVPPGQVSILQRDGAAFRIGG